MPIYEYTCDSCGAMRELILKPGQDARPTCPTCRRRMRRVISPTSFILKGSGWYVTDYPSESRKKGLEGEKAPTASESGEAKKKEPAAGKRAAAAGGTAPVKTAKKTK